MRPLGTQHAVGLASLNAALLFALFGASHYSTGFWGFVNVLLFPEWQTTIVSTLLLLIAVGWATLYGLTSERDILRIVKRGGQAGALAAGAIYPTAILLSPIFPHNFPILRFFAFLAWPVAMVVGGGIGTVLATINGVIIWQIERGPDLVTVRES